MRYHVLWTPSALNELAALWLDADATFRAAITAAAASIDALLVDSPDEVGESRDGQRRIAFVRPLAFHFEIRSLDQRVVVTHVWSMK
jgi:hypothetical protein